MSDPDLPRLRATLMALFPPPAAVRLVLSVGCGSFPTAGPLRRLFPAAMLVGIDHSLDDLRAGRGRWGVADVRLIGGDAARMPLAGMARFDLILIRHPDVDRHPERWRQVCRALPRVLSPGGRVLVSCYAAHEMAAIRAGLIAGGAKPLPARLSLAPVDLIGQDRWLVGFMCEPASGRPD